MSILSNLVKAFNMIHYELLLQILLKYGMLHKLMTAVTKKQVQELQNETNKQNKKLWTVRQHEPYPFLFKMKAIMETLISIPKEEFRHFPQTNNPLTQCGRLLLRQPTGSKGTTFNIDSLLYIDDVTFVFQTRDDIKKGAKSSMTILPTLA